MKCEYNRTYRHNFLLLFKCSIYIQEGIIFLQNILIASNSLPRNSSRILYDTLYNAYHTKSSFINYWKFSTILFFIKVKLNFLYFSLTLLLCFFLFLKAWLHFFGSKTSRLYAIYEKRFGCLVIWKIKVFKYYKPIFFN